MKPVITVLLTFVASAAFAQDLRLPFDGRWFVMQGGDTPNVNEHMRVAAQAFGIDFAKVGGDSARQLTSVPRPTKPEDFFGWGAEVRAPISGTIVAVVNDLPDNPLGTKDSVNVAGNHVVIKVRDDRFVYVAHMQRGSVLVKVGDAVTAGGLLGKCGNSGNSDFPHIHLHIQNTPQLNGGLGQNPVFVRIDVELNGQRFTGVTWPLIRGLFVSNNQ